MFESELKAIFQKLRQGSSQSVQSGQSFNELEKYLHVERHVETYLTKLMQEINDIGHGLIMLIGSAGDGKSHLMSSIKQDHPSLAEDFVFYNDATESYSPNCSSIDTLKRVLVDYRDDRVDITSRKLVLAINLGKLNAFIEDEENKLNYTRLIDVVSCLFDDDLATSGNRKQEGPIRFIDFSCQQMFEMEFDSAKEYPITSKFLRKLLEKICKPASDNPFYNAYKNSVVDGKHDPIVTNYEILQNRSVQNTLIKLIIECIVRYKLIVTPREFLDFISSVIIYSGLEDYKPRKDYFKALLPSLLYENTGNRILEAISKLDPIKYSSTEHNQDLAVLFTASEPPADYIGEDLKKLGLYNSIKSYYENNGRDTTNLTKFLFRLKHLKSYHSESETYKRFITYLVGYYRHDLVNSVLPLYELVNTAIPRHYGSYDSATDMVPLNIQGSRFRLYASVAKEEDYVHAEYNEENPNSFNLFMVMNWVSNGVKVTLKLDYQQFEYLSSLNEGRLSLNYEGDRSHDFSRFIHELVKNSDAKKKVTIKTDEEISKTLSKFMGSHIKLS